MSAKFNESDLVWARVKGYTHWPAIITAKNHNGTFRIKFFGSGDERTVPAKSKKLWRNREQFGPSRKCRSLFDAGIQEIEHVLREREQDTSQNETEHFDDVVSPTQSLETSLDRSSPPTPVETPSCVSPVAQCSAMGSPITSGLPVIQVVVSVTPPHQGVAVASPNGSSTLEGRARSGPKRGHDGRFKAIGGDGECSFAANRFLKDIEDKIRLGGNKRARTDDGSFANVTPEARNWRVFIMQQWPGGTITCCGDDYVDPGKLRHHIVKHVKHKKYRLG